MKTVIISGGNIQETFTSGFLSEYQYDFMIAADSGLDYCLQSGHFPDMIVGDFDSLQHQDLLKAAEPADENVFSAASGEHDEVHEQMLTISNRKIRMIRHRPEKDATDTELAVTLAIAQGTDEVVLLGATGTRLDHVWGNISLLCRLREMHIRGWMIDANNRISMPFEKEIRLKKNEQFGKYVSILPYGGPVTGLTLTGFHYPLTDYTLKPGQESLCVSNEIESETAQIRYQSGIPVVVESRD